jgi:hypothetical protein
MNDDVSLVDQLGASDPESYAALTHPGLQPVWHRWLNLWDNLAAPVPFGIDWDDEVAAEVFTLYRQLCRNGVRFAKLFAEDMETMFKAVAAGELRERAQPQNERERLLLQWSMVQAGEDFDDSGDGDIAAACSLVSAMRTAGMEIPADLHAAFDGLRGWHCNLSEDESDTDYFRQ